MKTKTHYLPPRQSVIFAATRRMLDETNQNMLTFAMAVAEQYVQNTAPDVRTVPLALGEGEQLISAMKTNAQTLRRYMDGTVKTLPADLEDAWVLALPEAYRSALERDLARRRGLMVIHLLPDTPEASAAGLSELAKEFGELLNALAPALRDGHLDRSDIRHAKKILNESDDLISAVLSIRRQVNNVLHEAVNVR